MPLVVFCGSVVFLKSTGQPMGPPGLGSLWNGAEGVGHVDRISGWL